MPTNNKTPTPHPPKKQNPKIWVITLPQTGDEIRAIGIAHALSNIAHTQKNITYQIERKHITPKSWRRLFAPFARAAKRDNITPPWPNITIVAGRHAIAYARKIKKASNKKCFTIALQDPKYKYDLFDFIWTPTHDKTKIKKAFSTLTSPHNLTTKTLEQEAKTKEQDFLKQNITPPYVAVLLGGPSKSQAFNTHHQTHLCKDLKSLAQAGAGLLITSSFRTPPQLIHMIKTHLANADYFLWTQNTKTPNPYPAILGCADYILATADSTNMISEATLTGKPIFIFPLGEGSKRLAFFHQALIDKNIAQLWEGQLKKPKTNYTPINATDEIAQAIWKQLSQKT